MFIKSARCRKAGREQFQSKGLTFTLSVDINRKPLKLSNSAKMNPSWNSEVAILLIVGCIWIFSIWRFLRNSVLYIIEARGPIRYLKVFKSIRCKKQCCTRLMRFEHV